ncbi:MAG: hypothetical protein CBD62_00970 [Candidatus Pelagibacter sp. TMED202]|nr:MAG: hypothetical protein CBD62_00970 [Candidatus Pelagibacter sp. TMED202]|tara:strand:+ start:4992 stop:5414 length:423 start_codon:yes stop_codon:yes gene_type:complete
MSDIYGKWKNNTQETSNSMIEEQIISLKQEQHNRDEYYDYDVNDMVKETFQYPTECKHEVSIPFRIDRDEYNEQLEKPKTFMNWLDELRKEKFELHHVERNGRPYRFCDDCKENIIEKIRDEFVEVEDLNEHQILKDDYK